MKTQELQKELQGKLYETVRGLYVKQAREFGYHNDEDFCEECATKTSEDIARDCIKVINKKDWNFPENNFYTFDFAMKSEYNIIDKAQLLNRRDAADIVCNWFWQCFGTYNLLYNFTTALTEIAETESCNA